MIRYALICSDGHQFDSWFQNAAAYEKLSQSGQLGCAVCGKSDVEKALMAPGIAHGSTGNDGDQDVTPTAMLSPPLSKYEAVLREMRAKIEANSEDVGQKFASEARAIHNGEAPKRSIYGEALGQEVRDLIEDGVPIAPLPWGNRRTN